MAITYPRSFPAGVAPNQVKILVRHATSMSQSPFSFAQQVQQHLGDIVGAEVSFPPLNADKAADLTAWLLSMRGREKTFHLKPYGHPLRGSGNGSPVLAEAAAVRTATLVTSGWVPNSSYVLKAGDWFQIGVSSAARLYRTLEDVHADALGFASFEISPRVRDGYFGGEALILNNPVGTFRLNESDVTWDVQVLPLTNTTFRALEAL